MIDGLADQAVAKPITVSRRRVRDWQAYAPAHTSST